MSLSSLVICSLTLVVLSGTVGAGVTPYSHPFSQRTFKELGCKGVYEKENLSRLDRVCEDCYNLHRIFELYNLCRKECFSSVYFPSCLQVLCMHDQQPEFREKVKKLGGKGFDILPYPTTMSPSAE